MSRCLSFRYYVVHPRLLCRGGHRKALPLLTNRLTNSMGLDGVRGTIRNKMGLRVQTGWYSLWMWGTEQDRGPLSFNQGVAGSRPARPTKARRPSLLGGFEKNQGVKTLGQPTPWFYYFCNKRSIYSIEKLIGGGWIRTFIQVWLWFVDFCITWNDNVRLLSTLYNDRELQT